MKNHSTLGDILYFYYTPDGHPCLYFLVGINTLGLESVLAAGTFSLRFFLIFFESRIYSRILNRLILLPAFFLFIFPFLRVQVDEENAVGQW